MPLSSINVTRRKPSVVTGTWAGLSNRPAGEGTREGRGRSAMRNLPLPSVRVWAATRPLRQNLSRAWAAGCVHGETGEHVGVLGLTSTVPRSPLAELPAPAPMRTKAPSTRTTRMLFMPHTPLAGEGGTQRGAALFPLLV